MTKENNKANVDRADYTNTSNYLQNVVLVFLGFLLFSSFAILLPYYFYVADYKEAKINEGITKEINEDIVALKNAVNNLFKYPQYNATNFKADNVSGEYYKKLIESYNKSSQPQTKERIPNIETYPQCGSYNGTKKWLDCNFYSNRSQTRSQSSILIDTNKTKEIGDRILKLDNSLSRLSNNDTVLHSINLNKLKVGMTELEKTINKFPNNTMGFTLASFDNFSSAASNLTVLNIPNITDYLKNVTSDFKKQIDSLEYPIVGKIPLSFSEFFLAFPIVIGIGFSFMSLQFKKLISIHNELKLSENDGLISWLDPLQHFPEKSYPLLIIALPFILFLTFSYLIYDTWFDPNNQYLQDYDSQTTNNPLLVPSYIRYVVIALIGISVILFGCSYYLIIQTCRTK